MYQISKKVKNLDFSNSKKLDHLQLDDVLRHSLYIIQKRDDMLPMEIRFSVRTLDNLVLTIGDDFVFGGECISKLSGERLNMVGTIYLLAEFFKKALPDPERDKDVIMSVIPLTIPQLIGLKKDEDCFIIYYHIILLESKARDILLSCAGDEASFIPIKELSPQKDEDKIYQETLVEVRDGCYTNFQEKI